MKNLKEVRVIKHKYNVIGKYEKEEPFTGIFQTKKECQEWYNIYGIMWESKGYKLIKKTVEVYE